MDMWLCIKRAITAAERAKKAYEEGMVKVVEAGKALQAQAHLVKDMQAAERQVKAYKVKFAEMSAALESAQQVALEEYERAKELPSVNRVLCPAGQGSGLPLYWKALPRR